MLKTSHRAVISPPVLDVAQREAESTLRLSRTTVYITLNIPSAVVV